MAQDLTAWRYHVIDTRTNTVAAVYNYRGDAERFIEARNEAFPNRYRLADMYKDPTGLGKRVGEFFR